MSVVARIRKPGGALSWQSADVWTREADAVSLPRLDEVGGHPRPSGVGVTYAEQEYHALAEEQELIWPAEGECEARRYQVRARGCDREAESTGFLLAESDPIPRVSG